jgi:hypothetical protein
MIQLSQLPLSKSARLWRWGAIATCLAPVLGAYLHTVNLRVGWDCPIRYWTGIPCPTCGMTRSFVALARGDWGHALTHHALGPVLFGGFLLVAIHLACELVAGKSIKAFYSDWLGRSPVWVSLFTVLLGYHSLRLYHLHQAGDLYLSFLNSPLGQFLWSRGA